MNVNEGRPAGKSNIDEKLKSRKIIRLENILKNVPVDDLRDFIINYAKDNPELYNAAFYKFIVREKTAKDSSENNERQDIEILGQWLNKAKECVDQNKYDEAIKICKAIIEEYSKWLNNLEENISLIFSSDFLFNLFSTFEKAAEHTDKKQLLAYCLTELKKIKYLDADVVFNNYFHRLFGILSIAIDQDAFITVQDELLAGIKDKGSYEAKNILERKVAYYRHIGNNDMAWLTMEENLQIDSFCMKVVENRIEKHDFVAAKDLINDFIARQNKNPNSYINSAWYNLLLDIFKKENDKIPVRKKSTSGISKRPRYTKPNKGTGI